MLDAAASRYNKDILLQTSFLDKIFLFLEQSLLYYCKTLLPFLIPIDVLCYQVYTANHIKLLLFGERRRRYDHAL